ncbi:hypothetical protein AGMMS49928_24300 [Spirochaetia bacterium]|nr:hypothetical protein AGMMS49928_24300 [Spirochaetia bacterium]
MNLRDRLRRIRSDFIRSDSIRAINPQKNDDHADVSSVEIPPSWESCGHLCLKRSLIIDSVIPPGEPFPKALGILVPDLAFMTIASDKENLRPEDLLFFDLETTGLSGGAGTVAFLAAFGRFEKNTLAVTQYLLLDYPGENDFLEAILKEFSSSIIVSYNGKTFDAQIFRNRCLMNGIMPPEYRHADLLHPCRRLWKRILPSCSQGQIESSVLGLDRTDDVPGAMAPEIWFSFLKSGDFSALEGIANHNVKDISGLAHIFAALVKIARAPLQSRKIYHHDIENLALRWRQFLRSAASRGPFPEETETAKTLLQTAADEAFPRAAYILAGDLFRQGNHDEGIRYLQKITGGNFPLEDRPGENQQAALQALAYRKLSIDADRRQGRPDLALFYLDEALALGNLRETLRGELEGRRERVSCHS